MNSSIKSVDAFRVSSSVSSPSSGHSICSYVHGGQKIFLLYLLFTPVLGFDQSCVGDDEYSKLVFLLKFDVCHHNTVLFTSTAIASLVFPAKNNIGVAIALCFNSVWRSKWSFLPSWTDPNTWNAETEISVHARALNDCLVPHDKSKNTKKKVSKETFSHMFDQGNRTFACVILEMVDNLFLVLPCVSSVEDMEMVEFDMNNDLGKSRGGHGPDIRDFGGIRDPLSSARIDNFTIRIRSVTKRISGIRISVKIRIFAGYPLRPVI
ncbi:unnamed protein product [Cochlearia groenlandica]